MKNILLVKYSTLWESQTAAAQDGVPSSKVFRLRIHKRSPNPPNSYELACWDPDSDNNLQERLGSLLREIIKYLIIIRCSIC